MNTKDSDVEVPMKERAADASVLRQESPSTVGRGRRYTSTALPHAPRYVEDLITVCHGDALALYAEWDRPTVIVSDGAYGILGFEGDTSDHLALAQWYEPHIAAWSRYASARTTLWFWNSEIGWAAVHPVLERHGWRYMNANIWNKGKAHIAGNVNTSRIRRFPVVSEVCVQYTFEARINGETLQRWLLAEWKRTGLSLQSANVACGVKDVAVRKYLDRGHLWYFPPPEMFERMANYANAHGRIEGRPYFSRDGMNAVTRAEWAEMRSLFNCPHGVTNVWDRPPLKGAERIKVPSGNSKALHLNQKPLDLMSRVIAATSNEYDVVWEPFGGLFSASLAARSLRRRAFAAEIDPTYFQLGVSRLQSATDLFSGLSGVQLNRR